MSNVETHVINSHGCPINVQVEGPKDAPALLLSNSLGTDLHMWDPQVPAFTKHFRLVRYDRRGHGRSGAPRGPYSMELLGKDVLAILDGLGIQKANWCGLSMGGMVGMWLGANAPERLERIVLSNTGPYYADKQSWTDRMALVMERGVDAIVEGTMQRWFTPEFRQNNPDMVARLSEIMRTTPKDGYVGCCAAVRDMDHRDLLARIPVPTLIVCGRHDPATTVEMGEYMRERIPNSEMTILEAAHVSNIEQPQAFTDAVVGFLTRR
jgi:3-oxoadipate enol-lactonase